MINLKNYYLDIDSVSKLDEDNGNRIHSYYMDMLSAPNDTISISLFNTLNKSGYLKEVRDEKLKELLDEK